MLTPGGAGSEVWNRVYMIAPVKKFGRVGLCTNFIPNKHGLKHGGGEEGELAELAVYIFGVRAFVLVQHYFCHSKFKHSREGFDRFFYLCFYLIWLPFLLFLVLTLGVLKHFLTHFTAARFALLFH